MPSLAEPRAKVVDVAEAVRRLRALRAAGGRAVFTNGCFDLLHVGHACLFDAARRLGECLVVAINSDRSIRELKGAGRPIVPEAERALLLAHLAAVDLVIVFDEDKPLRLLEALRPEVLVKGGDYVPATVVGRDYVEGYGGQVHIIPFVPGSSTSEIIRRVREAPEG